MTTTATTALAAGTWIGDPVHPAISFRVRHMGVGRVRGSFALTSAALTVGDDGAPSSSQVTAVVLYMSMSVDGFIAGPNEGPENGLGDGGHRLHE
jgi:polyisoprenoid-binding protein YceI